MNKKIFSRILWAVDALGEDPIHKQSLLVLGAMVRATGAEVEPVFVLSAGGADLPNIPFQRFEEAYRALAEKEFARICRNCDLPGLKPLKILVSSENSKRHDPVVLLEYARESGADLIVVSSHARHGISRALLGSFTESLLMRSSIPVLTVNPDTEVREGIRKILFATDFAPRFFGPFQEAVDLARTLDADLTIFYKEPAVKSKFMNPEVRAYLEEDTSLRMQRAREWEKSGKDKGVRIQLILDRTPGSVVSAIADAVRSGHYDLVMLGSQADPTTTWLLGSKAREISLQSSCPVCVLRTE